MDPDTLQLTIDPHTTADCWPVTDVLYAQVPKDYPVAQKAEGYAALSMLAWSINSTTIRPWSDKAMFVQVGSISSLSAPLIAALNSITCDGETLLVTLPIVWQVSKPIRTAAVVIGVLGLIGTIATFAFIVQLRHHPVIRSTAPAFQSVCLLGIVFLLAAMQLLVVPSPTDSVCSAVNWLTQLGFTLLFGPPFMKALRIYRIFGRRKLKVVKISNVKLMAWYGVILLAEMIYLAVWQGIAPMSSLITTQLESDQREHSYQQCSFSALPSGQHFFAAVIVVKGVWLASGILLAFHTRSVTDTFNESKAVALKICNLVLAVGLVAPLIILVGAVGDTLLILLMFAMTWISYVCLLILSIPKALALHAAHSNAANASKSETLSSTMGFSFLTLAHLSSVGTLTQYVTALEKHLTEARGKLRGMKEKTRQLGLGSKVSVGSRSSGGAEMVTPTLGGSRSEEGEKGVGGVGGVSQVSMQKWVVGMEGLEKSPSVAPRAVMSQSRRLSQARSTSISAEGEE